MKNCIGCKNADWKRTAANKLHPSGDGRCLVKVSMPKLPASMYWIGGEPKPCGGRISRKEEHKDHCPYYLREIK